MELSKHEMNILDDPILREQSAKHFRKTTDATLLKLKNEPSHPDNPIEINNLVDEQADNLDNEEEVEDTMRVVNQSSRHRDNEESSIMFNKSLLTAHNMSVMDTSLAINKSILVVHCNIL